MVNCTTKEKNSLQESMAFEMCGHLATLAPLIFLSQVVALAKTFNKIPRNSKSNKSSNSASLLFQ